MSYLGIRIRWERMTALSALRARPRFGFGEEPPAAGCVGRWTMTEVRARERHGSVTS